jgi:gliding motility-associated-like protein
MVKSLQKRNLKNIMKQFVIKGLVLVLLAIAGLSQKVQATHMMGADITYKCLGNNKYEFTIKMYRDCRGVPIGAPGSRILCKSSGANITSFTPTEINVRDVTPTCASGGKPCNPPNTTAGKGVEEHTYTYTYDFTNAIKNGCCRVVIGSGQCCRNSEITTGASNQDFWTTAEIDICLKKIPGKCNSSPSLTSEPVAILCCNQPYYYNNGASDTTDFDSLSYRWDDPLTSFSGTTSWAGGRSRTSPFSDYWPIGYDKNKGPNPNVNPPIGTFLDPETGDIIFTPTDCSESTVASIKVTEWRKDSSGKWQDIGFTHRDVQFWTITCPDNNPPLLYGPYKYDVCAGTQICFTITSDDKQFIPPPPAKPNPPDTVKLTWNRGIPGGTFNIIDPKERLQKGKFCWTPKKNQASDLPYTFTVTARDNACPRNAVTVKSYSVKVKQIAEAVRYYDTLICGIYTVESKLASNFKGTPSYLWEISDSANKPLDNKFYFFKPSKSIKSNKAKDTIQFRKGGKYIIHHRINNPPLNCPSDYFDTLIVPPLLEVDLALGPDSFVCAGTTLRLGAKAANGVPKFYYKWFTPNSHDTKDTLTYLDVYMSTHDTTFRVEITDKNKCTAFDTINVFLKPNPKVDMGPDLRICWYGEVTLTPNAKNAYWVDPQIGDTLQQGDTLWWNWKRNGIDFSTDTVATYTERGIYTVTVRDSLGCNWTDTMNLYVNDTLYPNAGPDQTKCFNDTLILIASGLDTVANKKSGTYIWYKGLPKTPPGVSTKEKWSSVVQTSNDYLLELQVQEDTTRCYGFDTTFITVNALPVLTLIPPQKYCCDYGDIALGSSSFASPTGGTWTCRQVPAYIANQNKFLTTQACDPKKPGVFTLIYRYQDPNTSCINKDSTRFTINPLPALQLRGGYYCQDKIEAPLKPHIVAPINLNTMVDVKWRLLKSLQKPGGGQNTITDLVYDNDPSFNYDFRLKVDSGTIDLGTSPKDSIILEITVQDGAGCFNKDTMTIYIWKLPVITFNIFPDLCIDAGIVDLKKLSNVKPNDGCWTVIDAPGFCNSSRLLPGMMGCDSLNTLKLNLINGPCLYKMRYTHTASGCPVQRDTNLRINPLPNVSISITPTGDVGKFCEIDPDVTLNGTPVGGIWSSSIPGVISGGKFKPTSVSAAERDKWITLTYTYIHPTTKCDTAKSLKVFVQSKPVVDILTLDYDTCRTNTMNFSLLANYKFTSKINWVQSADPLRASFENNTQLSNNNPTILTVRPRSDSATNIFITCFTEAEGVCPFSQDAMNIVIHPVPHATFMVDDPNGCVPHIANFTSKINNGVDSSKASYLWTFGEPTDATTQYASHTFNNAGPFDVRLKITSDFGCDTLLGPLPIEAYPIPTASFTPVSNSGTNRTTAALPRFRITNESTTKQLILGSKLVKYNWDFGDLNIDTDTSTKTNPEYYYSSDTGKYYITLIVETNHGCKDTAQRLVIVDPDILVFIPNVFTPDGAGPLKNDKFWVEASGFISYQILIFNRWGEKLYESTELDRPWDGKYKGELCQMDAYVYQVNVTSFSGELYKYNGTVILAR